MFENTLRDAGERGVLVSALSSTHMLLKVNQGLVNDYNEVATAAERFRAECRRLESENRNLHAACGHAEQACDALQRDLDEARAALAPDHDVTYPVRLDTAERENTRLQALLDEAKRENTRLRVLNSYLINTREAETERSRRADAKRLADLERELAETRRERDSYRNTLVANGLHLQ